MGPQIEPFPVSKTAWQQAPPKKGLLPHFVATLGWGAAVVAVAVACHDRPGH
jgi:hypothetical protein